jgi:hypothetical protein
MVASTLPSMTSVSQFEISTPLSRMLTPMNNLLPCASDVGQHHRSALCHRSAPWPVRHGLGGRGIIAGSDRLRCCLSGRWSSRHRRAASAGLVRGGARHACSGRGVHRRWCTSVGCCAQRGFDTACFGCSIASTEIDHRVSSLRGVAAMTMSLSAPIGFVQHKLHRSLADFSAVGTGECKGGEQF